MPTKNLLSDIPAAVVESAKKMADYEAERLIGYRPITEPDGPNRVKPVRWAVTTNAGVYEFMPDGTAVRASLLHPFTEPTYRDDGGGSSDIAEGTVLHDLAPMPLDWYDHEETGKMFLATIDGVEGRVHLFASEVNR